MRSYRPEELFDADGRLVPDLAALAPAGDRRMSANPHANGGLLLPRPGPARLPRLRRRRSSDRAPAASRGHPGARRLPARRHRRQPGHASGSSARTRPRPTGCRPCSRPPTGPGDAEIVARRRPPGPARPGHGGAVRAPVPGLARGLPADRPARPVQLLRGVHPHRRLDVQPARQVAGGLQPDSPWRRPDRLAQLPALLARLAPGPQRLLPPGPRLHRPRGEQEGRGRPGLPAAGRQHACCPSPTTACAAATTST